ncbi:MAG: hypothetical protein AB7U85_07095 [Alphaproteobacteria bacterium]
MKKILCVLLMFVMTACAAVKKTEIKNYDISFDDGEIITLDAKEMKIKILYEPPFKAPNIEHLMPYPLEKAILGWAKAKLKVSGKGENIAVFTINNASVVQAITDEGLLKGGDRETYKANVEISLEIQDYKGGKTEAVANAWQDYTRPLVMTLSQREEVWFNMVKDVTNDAGGKLEATIKEFLSSYIVEE